MRRNIFRASLLSVCLSVCLCVCLCVCVSVCLSITMLRNSLNDITDHSLTLLSSFPPFIPSMFYLLSWFPPFLVFSRLYRIPSMIISDETRFPGRFRWAERVTEIQIFLLCCAVFLLLSLCCCIFQEKRSHLPWEEIKLCSLHPVNQSTENYI